MPKLALSPAHLRVLSSRSAAGRGFTSSPSDRLAQARHGLLNEPRLPSPTVAPIPAAYFSPDRVRRLIDGLENSKQNGHRPPDERTLKLGKTLRILSPLLPTILYNVVPKEILSPHVSLHLFPSTHPHLPTVSGTSLYYPGLWTTPIAWGSIPLIGNVRLKVLSERIVRAGTILDPEHADQHDCGDERLVIRFQTEPRTGNGLDHQAQPHSKGSSYSAEMISHPHTQTQDSISLSASEGTIISTLSRLLGNGPIVKLSKEKQFTGLFIFAFDEEGRISTVTLEHSNEAGGWDRTSKFVTLTDWLIGKARGSLEPAPNPGLAMGSCGECGLPASNTRYPRRS